MSSSFLSRLRAPFRISTSPPVTHGATIDAPPKRLLEQKADSLSLLPRGAYGSNIVFFSPDGGRTEIPIEGSVTGQTVLAFVAYWMCATRWRASKLAEAPLMVVRENQDDGSDEWLPDHPMASLLDSPSDDYDMGELIEITSHYCDNSGACLWVHDTDRVGDVQRITPFPRWQFEPRSSDTRLFAEFRVQTRHGLETFPADRATLFRDFVSPSWDWTVGRSRLDIATSWLKLGRVAVQTIHDLLGNAMWPSAVIIPDKEWNPDPTTLASYKQDLESYALQGQKGRPFVQLGGGSFMALQSQIKDLVPDEVLNRVESVVAAISGVPAIVLQFEVGLQNSPWSQMAQARRMAYDDTISPQWRKFERVLTRQLLRVRDDDNTHYIRFDTSKITSLQADQADATQIAVMMGRAASVNERRKQMGLEPVPAEYDPDGKANAIPELATPDFATLLAGLSGSRTDTTDESTDDATVADTPRTTGTIPVATDDVATTALNGAQVSSLVNVVIQVTLGVLTVDSARGIVAAAFPTLTEAQIDDIFDGIVEGSAASSASAIPTTDTVKAMRRHVEHALHRSVVPPRFARKFAAPVLQHALRNDAITVWMAHLSLLLKHDADAIATIVQDMLAEPVSEKGLAIQIKSRGSERVLSAVTGYLRSTSRQSWSKTTTPLLVQAAERSTAVIAADMNISFSLLHKHAIEFASREAGQMITSVSNTTKRLVSDIVQGGLEAGESTATIAKTIRDATGFSLTRATLIARTETTTVFAGAPTESLISLAKATDRSFTKTWSGVLDDRERDEHVAMEGETVGIDEAFSNGLQFPSEPNCRCTLLYTEVTDE